MLKYAIDIATGKAVHVDELPPERNGDRCGCRCPDPDCQEPMRARKGRGRENGGHDSHFAHQPGSSKPEVCQHAPETSLHQLAKDILQNSKLFLMPDLHYEKAWFNPRENEYEISSELHTKSRQVQVIEAIPEQRIEDVVPDIFLTYEKSNGQKDNAIVEIYVTHKVDAEKISKIKRLNIPTIEIDLSEVDRNISRDDLEAILLGESDLKSWKYHPITERKKEESWQRAKAFEKKCRENAERRAKEKRERKERWEREREEKRKTADDLDIEYIDGHQFVYACPFCKTRASVELHCKGGGGRWCEHNLGFLETGDGVCCDGLNFVRRALENGCPKCGSKIVERLNRKEGTTFYACSNYACSFTANKIDCEHVWVPNVEKYPEIKPIFEQQDNRTLLQERYRCSICGGVFTSKIYALAHAEEEAEEIGNPDIKVRIIEDHLYDGGIYDVKVGEETVWRERTVGFKCSKCGALMPC